MARVDLSFKKGDSLFHRMTPFSKLLFVLSVSFVAIFNTNLYVGAGLFVLCLIIALFFTSVPIKEYWALGKIIIPFITILAVVFPFFYGGQATVGSDAIALRTPIKDLSWAALGFGALLALRFLALATAGLAFAFTTHPTDMVQNLSRRGWDYRSQCLFSDCVMARLRRWRLISGVTEHTRPGLSCARFQSIEVERFLPGRFSCCR